MYGLTFDLTVLQPALFWALACMAVIGDSGPFTVPGPPRRLANVFVSVCFSFAILLVWGLGWAIVVQTVAIVIASLRLRFGMERTLVHVAQFALALVAAAAALRALGHPSFEPGQRMTSLDGLAMAVAAASWFVVDYTVLVLWLRFREFRSWRHVFVPRLGYEMLSTGALLLLAPLLVGGPTGWALLLVLVPVIAVSQLAWLYNEQAEQLRRDSLTGLLSRRAITDEIDDLAAQQPHIGESRSHHRFALVLLDLDRFRQVNVTLGHAVGNRLLIAVAARLADSVRKTDLVARLGGDEFAIVQADVPDTCAALALADHVARILAAPADIDGHQIDIDASVGVALFPDHGQDTPTLMRHAEVAVYQVKHGLGTTAIYTPEEDQAAARRLSLLADLRQALENPAHRDEIEFCYQPQVSIGTGKVVGAEALLRWHHPDRGLVNVEDIFQAAEHSPVMGQLTQRVVDDVVAQLARWNSTGLTQRAAINVSVRDLETPDLRNHISSALQLGHVQPRQLTVEITETALMGEIGSAQATLRNLADLGIVIALDDFGTGYSSMAHLRRLPVSEIKIDRSFTSRMAKDRDDSAIVRSIIDLGHDLGLHVVAEGVEDKQTYEMLAEAGCDIAQGWLIARAMPAEQFLDWLTKQNQREPPDGLLSDPA
jgi:diguanylate cyclase (GGDEF)-like protein